MNCKEFSFLLDDAFRNRSLPDEEVSALRAHAAECPHCAALLQAMEDCRKADEETEAPVSFSAAWRQRIREESAKEEKARKRRTWRGMLAAAAMLIFVVGGTLLTRDRQPILSARPAREMRASEMNEAPSMALGLASNSAAREESVVFEDAAAPMAEAYEMEAEEAVWDAEEAAWETEEAPEEMAAPIALAVPNAKSAAAAGPTSTPRPLATAVPAPTGSPAKSENAAAQERTDSEPMDILAEGRQFLRDMLAFLASALPWLAGIGLAALIVTAIIKRKKKE